MLICPFHSPLPEAVGKIGGDDLQLVPFLHNVHILQSVYHCLHQNIIFSFCVGGDTAKVWGRWNVIKKIKVHSEVPRVIVIAISKVPVKDLFIVWVDFVQSISMTLSH